MILQLLTTTLLLLGGGGRYQVAYNQVDTISAVVDTYEVHQRATIDNESGNLEISYNITSNEFGTFSIFGDIDTIGIDEYIDDIPSYLDFVPLFWFTFENGEFVPIENNALSLNIGLYNGNTESILTNTSEYGYLYLESYIGSNIDDSYYYGQPLEDLYYQITGLMEYNYDDVGEGFFYHHFTFYLDVDDWVITGDNFADLNLDLYFTIGHYKRLKEMSYNVNGLGSKIENIYQQGIIEGTDMDAEAAYQAGMAAGVADGYAKGLEVGQSQCNLASQNPSINGFFNVLSNAGAGLATFLAIPLLPGISLGTLIAVFVGLPLLVMLLKHLGK